ncbi:MAG: hypothetical protein GF311_12065 [Candidatus Lokiarchaeota archaeon]|nr:hypothetical protein [Candidatus Lokiarchaeota archaeon]
MKKYNQSLSSSQIYDAYLDLKSTNLWYDGEGQYDYGFIESINTASSTRNTKRNLIDNVMPIILLVENMPSSPSTEYKNQIIQMLDLINTTEFWNATNGHFMDYNSSTGDIFAQSNLYAILATLKIYQNTNFDSEVQDQAFILANETMNTLNEYFWDKSDYGYYNSSDQDLSSFNTSKDLKTNALGILALIEMWLATDSSEYLTNATFLFEKIYNSNLRDGDRYRTDVSEWSGIFTNEFDLNYNAFMMMALLKFFDVSANISYYNNATAMYEAFQSNFYDSTNKAYDKTDSSSNKNLLANLRLTEAYLEAYELYQKTSLSSKFNKSGSPPEFIFDEDDLVTIANYTFTSNGNTCNIPNASIGYQLVYPNGTWFYEEIRTTNENGTDTFTFSINESLPIGQDYFVYIWANSTYFAYTDTSMIFTVSSGIKYISGLEDLTYLFQGERRNMTITFNNSRQEDVNLTFSVETQNAVSTNSPREFFLNSSELNALWINFSIISTAELGPTNFYFLLKNGSTLFLNYTVDVEIRNSLYLSRIAYDQNVVEGDIFYISINLENFLANETQSFNLSFVGDYIDNFKKEYFLSEGGFITIFKNLNLSEVINQNSITVQMLISKSSITFYNQSFTLQVVNKLEVLQSSFPSSVAQWSSAQFVLKIKNNKRTTESFSLYINGRLIQTELNELVPGVNRIQTSLVPTFNPYDFSVKSYQIVIKDAEGNEQLSFYCEIQVVLSIMNLILFYVVPILIPIAIVLYFKNKEMKTKLLRR